MLGLELGSPVSPPHLNHLEEAFRQESMKIILRIVGMAFQHRWRMAGAYAAMIGATVAYLFLPRLFGDAIDRVELALADNSLANSLTSSAMLSIVALILVL